MSACLLPSIFHQVEFAHDPTVVESNQNDTSAALAEALREAEHKLLVSRQMEHALKLQHQQATEEIESKVMHVREHIQWHIKFCVPTTIA